MFQISNMYRLLVGSSRILAVLLALTVSACDLDVPTINNSDRVELHSSEYAYKAPLSSIDKDKLEDIAYHYGRYSNGPALVTVTYNPASSNGSAMKAAHEAARIAKVLRKSGVKDIGTDILPVASEEPLLMVTYEQVTAHKPRNCKDLLSTASTSADVDEFGESYKFGCSVETNVAKQIQRPRDLMGQAAGRYTEGRRNTNIAEPYHSGTPNEPLDGEQASGE
jgi:type IV pilus biogenesis protein CpaD/CtpE